MSLKPADLSSGALLLERVPTGTGNQCANTDCVRMGRYRIRIAGHYVQGPSKLQRYSFICKPHATEALGIWSEVAGLSTDDAATEAVAA
jgi:hypothetical protein